MTTNAAEVEEAYAATAAALRRPSRSGVRMAKAVAAADRRRGRLPAACGSCSSRVLDIPQFELPAPSDILRHIASDPSFYITNARVTLWEAFLGFCLGLIGALVGGDGHGPLAASSSRPSRRWRCSCR